MSLDLELFFSKNCFEKSGGIVQRGDIFSKGVPSDESSDELSSSCLPQDRGRRAKMFRPCSSRSGFLFINSITLSG